LPDVGRLDYVEPKVKNLEAVAMRALLLLLILLCTSAFVHAQTGATPDPGRRVTVNLKKGAAVSGTFQRADSKRVFLEVEGEQTTIGLDDVASIVFMEAVPDSPAVKSIKALKSLAELAVRARSQREYVNRLLEVKALVEDQLPLIPEGDLREAISDAFKAYELVGEIWEQTAQSVPQEETSKMTKEAVTKTLNSARKRLGEAEALLKEP
jgi:hypothetical protein